ncbi:hypothetical protein Q7689_00650 [Nocardiopsis tropica]|uniref:hypothetical protein n=1 Tax=Nocardiopsis tropica TaxID=109330 RepID=UPI002E8C65A6|nr:hypothetical protein [Nocardiopsis tropica]
MSTAGVALLGLLGGVVLTICTDMLSEEARTRLDRLPQTLVKLAARRLPPQVRGDMELEWIAELHMFLHGDDAVPVTRLFKGLRFAGGLFGSAGKVGYELQDAELKADVDVARSKAVIVVSVASSPIFIALAYLASIPGYYFLASTALIVGHAIIGFNVWKSIVVIKLTRVTTDMLQLADITTELTSDWNSWVKSALEIKRQIAEYGPADSYVETRLLALVSMGDSCNIRAEVQQSESVGIAARNKNVDRWLMPWTLVDAAVSRASNWYQGCS